MNNRKLYPPKSIWTEMRKRRLEEVGYLCEDCSAPDAEEKFNPNKPHPFYPQGTPFRVYLVLAHKRHFERWNRRADCVVVCPACHAKMDVELRRKASSANYSPCGVIVVWVWSEGTRYLAAETKRYDALFEIIASLDDGMKFELCPEIMLSIAGSGIYRRCAGGITMLKETGVCRGFGAYLHQIVSDVLAGVA